MTLHEYIEAENKKTQAWIDEDPKNRWSTFYAPASHYEKNYGIKTVDEFKRMMLINDISDLHKDIYGFRPREFNFDEMTTKELEDTLDALCMEGSEQAHPMRNK